MAVKNYSGTYVTAQTFDLTVDTVTFTGSTTVNAGGSFTETGGAGGILFVATGVTITINSTGYIDIQGTRGAFITIKSSAANPRVADWQFFTFKGTSPNNTMKWCRFLHGKYCLIFQGHNPAEGKFQYLVLHPDQATFDTGFFISSSGAFTFTDIAVIGGGSPKISDASSTPTLKRFQFINNTDFSSIKKSATMEDWYLESSKSGPNFDVDTGEIVNSTGFYLNEGIGDAGTGRRMAGAAHNGTVNITTFQFRSRGIPCFNASSGGGIITLTGGDVFGGKAANEGIFASSANGIVVDDVAAYGNFEYDMDVFHPDASQMNANVDQSAGTNRSSEKFPATVTSISQASVGANGFTVNATTGARCKARVRYGTVSAVYTISTDWDAMPLLLDDEFSLESNVIDWATTGKKYSTNLNGGIALANLKSGTTYYYVIECEDMVGRKWRSSEQTATTTDSGGGSGSTAIMPFTLSLSADTAFTVEQS